MFVARRAFSSTASAAARTRVAVVGAGWWTQGWHLPHLNEHPDVDIVGIVEPARKPTSTMASAMLSVPELEEKYKAPTFDTFDEMLSADIGVDAVVCGAQHSAHYEVGMKAMDKGLHVFMEKPMTTDIKEAQELTAKAKESGKIFMVNNTANWRKQSVEAYEMVKRGEIGEVKHASVVFHTPLGVVFENPDNIGWIKPSGTMLGNGFGWGQLSHTFAWLYMVSGLTPSKVFTFAGHSEKTGADINDAITILCKNGATCTVSGVASIPGCCKIIENRLVGSDGYLAYCGTDEDKGLTASMGLEPFGSTGQLQLMRFDGRNETIDGFAFESLDTDGIGPESLQNFIKGCRGKPYFEGVGAEVGLRAVATIDAMYRCMQSGQVEDVHC